MSVILPRGHRAPLQRWRGGTWGAASAMARGYVVAPLQRCRGPDVDYDKRPLLHREASMKRLRLLPVVALVVLMLTALMALTTLTAQTKRAGAPAARKPFIVVEATIPEMRAAMEQGRLTSRELVRQYLIRIATYEDKLHAAITVNPHALAEAAARDRERAQGKIRGPLHGIPI